MRSWTIAFSGGVLLTLSLPVLPAFLWCCGGLIISVALACFTCGSRLQLFSAFLIGLCWASCNGSWQLQRWWSAPVAQSDIWAEGVVRTLPLNNGQITRFQFQLERRCSQPTLDTCQAHDWISDTRRIQLSVYEPLTLAPGQRWRWQLRLRRPHGYANPGGFDYEAWAVQHRIAATGYVRNPQAAQLLSPFTGQRLSEGLRYQLLQQLQLVAGKAQHLALIQALALGEGSAISEADWELFRASGTIHLMVISGSHITLVAGLVYWLAKAGVTVLPRLLLWQPAPVLGAAAALLAAWCYTALAGFNLPAQRALVMAAAAFSGVILRRHTHPWQVFALALLVLLILDPLAPISPGFWLSFIAVAILIHSVQGPGEPDEVPGYKLLRLATSAIWLQGKLSLVLIPLTALYFQQISWSAPLVNLLAIPLIGLVAVPLSLLCVVLACALPTLASSVIWFTDLLLGWYQEGLRALMQLLPEAQLSLPGLSNSGWILAILLSLGLVLSPWRTGKVFCFILLPATLLLREPELSANRLQMTVFDVGQGLAVLLRTAKHQLLYDAGPGQAEQYSAGTQIIIPSMLALGLPAPERIMISHADTDHAGGLPALIAAYPDAQLMVPAELAPDPPQASSQCRAGDHWRWDGVDFAVLHPGPGNWNRNNGSCVLLVTLGTQRILLTGDIERPAERALLAQLPPEHLTVMLAPHHGSNSSSSPAFIARTRPAHVVFTSGYRNRYQHPTLQVQARYSRAGSTAWLTAYDGALTMDFTGARDQVQISSYRLAHPHFWSRPAPRP